MIVVFMPYLIKWICLTKTSQHRSHFSDLYKVDVAVSFHWQASVDHCPTDIHSNEHLRSLVSLESPISSNMILYITSNSGIFISGLHSTMCSLMMFHVCPCLYFCSCFTQYRRCGGRRDATTIWWGLDLPTWRDTTLLGKGLSTSTEPEGEARNWIPLGSSWTHPMSFKCWVNNQGWF